MWWTPCGHSGWRNEEGCFPVSPVGSTLLHSPAAAAPPVTSRETHPQLTLSSLTRSLALFTHSLTTCLIIHSLTSVTYSLTPSLTHSHTLYSITHILMVVLAGQMEWSDRVQGLAVHGGSMRQQEFHDPPTAELGRPVSWGHT